MKKTYVIPALRWIVMEENLLQAVSKDKDNFADEDSGMDAKAERNFDEEGTGSKRSNLWENW